MKAEIVFTLYLFSVLFFILSIVFLAKYKRFQSEHIIKTADVYLFGLVFLTLYSFVMFLDSGKFVVERLVPSLVSNFEVYINYLMLISNIFFILLMSICYLISVLLMKEAPN